MTMRRKTRTVCVLWRGLLTALTTPTEGLPTTGTVGRPARTSRRKRGTGTSRRAFVEGFAHMGSEPVPFFRRGVTLVELLVVIFILLAVTAAAIPVVFPAIQNRRIREASRLVTSYFAGARDHAMRSGRSTGVLIERFEGLPQMGIVLSEVEVQAPYAGDTTLSRIKITGGVVTLPSGDSSFQTLVRPGDLLKLDFKGPLYKIGDPLAPDWNLDPVPRDTPPDGVPFQIFRQPAKTARAPLVLPESIAIDLLFSGDAGELFAPANPSDPTPVIIMFSPTGVVDRLYHSEGAPPVLQSEPPTGPIFLLLGRREKMPLDLSDNSMPIRDRPVNDLEQNNLVDLTNLWISIQPQTGHIASTENSPIVANYPIDSVNPFASQPDLDRLLLAINEARLLASEAQGMGGR